MSIAEQFNESLAGLYSVYQPIVDLGTTEIVGVEALMRSAGPLATPPDLLSAARTLGRQAELDWAARAAALRGALATDLCRPAALFINTEPSAAGTPPPPELIPVLEEAAGKLQVVVEYTEDTLVDAPEELLVAIQRVRSLGWMVAIDDVGVEPAALSMLSLVRPDIVKLDRSLVQEHPNAQSAETIAAVASYAERVGAAVVAEGVEQAEHVHTARSMGATHGQGYLWARPGPMPRFAAPHRPLTPVSPNPHGLPAPQGPRSHGPGPQGGGVPRATGAMNSPFTLVTSRRPAAATGREQLRAMTGRLESLAASASEPALFVATVQQLRLLSSASRQRLEQIVERGGAAWLVGADMTGDAPTGTRCHTIDPHASLATEWVAVAITPHASGAITAKALGHDRFVAAMTWDSDLAAACASRLLSRFGSGPYQPRESAHGSTPQALRAADEGRTAIEHAH